MDMAVDSHLKMNASALSNEGRDTGMVVIWSGIALRVFPPKVFECWAGLAARQHKLRSKTKENALTGI